MQFLRTLIWVLLAVILAAFAFNNWISVPVRLWGGLIADVNLPLLLGTAFALGFVPLYILHATSRWRTRARLAASDRTIADLRAATIVPAAPPPEPGEHTPPPPPVTIAKPEPPSPAPPSALP